MLNKEFNKNSGGGNDVWLLKKIPDSHTLRLLTV